MVKKLKDKQVSWKTYTSIFIGVSPMKLVKTVKDEKGDHVPIKVWNPIEKREQEEKLREKKAHGIVLRRTSKYGWASQPYHMETIEGLYAHNISSDRDVPKNKTAFIRVFNEIVEEIKVIIKTPDPRSNYEKGQLKMKNLEAISEALWKIVSTVDGEFKFVARVYGGNANRYGVTFETLRDAFGIEQIPEQYGDKYTKYLVKNKNMIVGYEKRKTGEEVYIRLVKGDLPLDSQKFL